MANPKINYAYFVESVSRKFTLRKNKCSNNNFGGPAKFMGGQLLNQTRFNGTNPALVQKNAMFLRFNPRVSPTTGDEQTARNHFAAGTRAAAAWRKDLSQVTRILSAWNDPSNGSAAGVYKKGYTLRGWLAAVAISASWQEMSLSAFPTYTPVA